VGYLQVDAFHIPFLDDSFDLVACKSVIGGLKTVYRDASTRSLAGQKLATNEIRRVLKPGACFLGAENLRATKVHQMLTWLHRRGRVGWRHLTQGEIRFLFGDYQRLHLRPYGFLGTRSRWSGYNRLTGGIDRVLSEWLPGRWLYIAFIVAQK
jgi:SAM-dependent methyltransferase